MRLLAIKRYYDYRREPDFAFVDVENLSEIGKLIEELRRKKIRNVGEFLLVSMRSYSMHISTFRNGLPKSTEEYFRKSELVTYISARELFIIADVYKDMLSE